MKISVVASALGNDPREVPRMARLLGIDGILLDEIQGGLDVAALTASGRRELRHLLAGQGRVLTGVQSALSPKGFMPGGDVDQELSRIGKLLEACAAMGGTVFCLDLGPLPPVPIETMPKPAITPRQAGLIIIPDMSAAPARDDPPTRPADPNAVAQVDQAMMALGALADRLRVPIALRSTLASLAAVHRVITVAACPSFGLDFDPVLALSDEWDMDRAFSRFAAMGIRHVRLRDAVLGADGRTRPAVVGRGSVDWRHLRSNLDETGYQAFATADPLEMPNRREAVRETVIFVGRTI